MRFGRKLENRLGNNIKNLREAFGETQEELGALLYVNRDTISKYELGKRGPSKEIIHSIAEHYYISDEELLNSVFPSMKKIDLTFDFSNENCEALFPIFLPEGIEKNPEQLTVYEKHKSIFLQLKGIQVERTDIMQQFGKNITEVLVGYEKIIDDAGEDELAGAIYANYLGLVILVRMSYVFFYDIAKEKTALSSLLIRCNPKVKKAFSKLGILDLEDIDDLDFSTCDDIINDCLCKLNSLEEYRDLAYYYSAFSYLVGAAENDMTEAFNRRVGIEMFAVLEQFNNKYVCIINSIIEKSRQSVDDK